MNVSLNIQIVCIYLLKILISNKLNENNWLDSDFSSETNYLKNFKIM